MNSIWVNFLIVVFFTESHATGISWNYDLKLEFDNRKSNNEVLGEYRAHSLCECSTMCQKDCGVFGYNGKQMKCRIHKKILTSELEDEEGWRYYTLFLPSDCKDILENGHLNSGVYDIFPYGTRIQPVGVYCDMETLNGGWTVIQRRVDGSLSFNRNWAEYKSGFGSPEQNIWLGNDVIHQLTKGKNSFLYVAITLRNGTKLFELYNGFSVSNEAEKYKLFLAGPATGTLGDMMFNPGDPYMSLSGIFFSTPDRDHDRSPRTVGCAEEFMGGWWFYYCHYAYLNGVWSSQSWSRPWYPTFMTGEDVRGTLMLIKRH